VVFLILGTLYTSRISILWVFPALTGHWWPISSYHKGEFLFYTSAVKIVKFLAKKSIYSLVNIELQKYYQGRGKNTMPDFDSTSIADTREQEANPCWQTAQKWWMSRLEYLFQITLHLLETIH
jgi:hypothetical protein